MRRIKLGLTLGALFALGVATNAQAASTASTWAASGTGSSAGGSKGAPAPFTGSWTLTATNNVDPLYRPATPLSWAWAWEGVTVRQTNIPACSDAAINNAQGVSVCPAGSKLSVSGDIPGAAFGPAGVAEGPNTECNGKKFEVYNGDPGELTLSIDGPAAECGGLGFLGAYPIPLTTAGGKTTMKWNVPENLQHPIGAGSEGALRGGGISFGKLVAGKSATAAKKKKKKKKKKVSALLTSINCKGTRDFTYTVVDTFGTHVLNSSAGECKAPKKKKKKKKK